MLEHMGEDCIPQPLWPHQSLALAPVAPATCNGSSINRPTNLQPTQLPKHPSKHASAHPAPSAAAPGDGLDKERLAALGMGAFASYGVISNLNCELGFRSRAAAAVAAEAATRVHVPAVPSSRCAVGFCTCRAATAEEAATGADCGGS